VHDIFRFFYIALRQYWITWVTGTGLAGFALWAVNYYSDAAADGTDEPPHQPYNLVLLLLVSGHLFRVA